MTMFHDHSVWSATIMVVGKTFCWNLVQKIQPLGISYQPTPPKNFAPSPLKISIGSGKVFLL